MKTILILGISTLLIGSIFSKPNSFNLEYKNSNLTDTNGIQLIDKIKLRKLCKSTDAKITWVAIYTNGCDGTKYLLQDVVNLKKMYLDRLQILLCSSESYDKIGRMKKVLNQYSVEVSPVYIIDSTSYHEDPEDSREKGFLFRNDICEPCRKDIIGVPYSIFFNKKGEVVYYGYPSQTDIDSLLNVYLK